MSRTKGKTACEEVKTSSLVVLVLSKSISGGECFVFYIEEIHDYLPPNPKKEPNLGGKRDSDMKRKYCYNQQLRNSYGQQTFTHMENHR